MKYKKMEKWKNIFDSRKKKKLNNFHYKMAK